MSSNGSRVRYIAEPIAASQRYPRILVVRLGAMGDIVHTLPAVASLKRSFPQSHLSWMVSAKWSWLLKGNPYVDEALEFDRSSLRSASRTYFELRKRTFDFAIDFQGLIQSAVIARLSGAKTVWGYHRAELREKPASTLYTRRIRTSAAHVVDKSLELAQHAGAAICVAEFPLPMGSPEDNLPSVPFVLACPLAGWISKQWPLDYYSRLGQLLSEELGVPLVLNVPPNSLLQVKNTEMHYSGLPGLLDATRRATAVVGVDSGPLHIAAALKKRGVAIFGPTDPARNGPYGCAIQVLRSPEVTTTYKRGGQISAAMRAITPEKVIKTLCGVVSFQSNTRT